jgi:hypothetical protein
VYVRVFLNPDSKVSFIYTYKHYKLFKLLCECDRINQNNNNYIYIKKKKKKKKALVCFICFYWKFVRIISGFASTCIVDN